MLSEEFLQVIIPIEGEWYDAILAAGAYSKAEDGILLLNNRQKVRREHALDS